VGIHAGKLLAFFGICLTMSSLEMGSGAEPLQNMGDQPVALGNK
jgi:hypothetical protein